MFCLISSFALIIHLRLYRSLYLNRSDKLYPGSARQYCISSNRPIEESFEASLVRIEYGCCSWTKGAWGGHFMGQGTGLAHC